MSAWLSEKLSRIKLGGQSENSLRTFEALEFLQLGIHHNTNLEAHLKYLYGCSFAPRMAMNAREALLHEGNGLDAKHAFAFGIDLQTQLAAVQLEDRPSLVKLIPALRAWQATYS